MKLEIVTKIDKRHTATLQKSDNDVMSAKYDVIVVFPIYGQFGAIRKPDFGGMSCKIWNFINSTFSSYKN